MTPKVVLITGVTSGGLGAALALKLASQKDRYQVFGTLRNVSKKSELFRLEAKSLGLDPDCIHLVELDVTSSESVHLCVQHVLSKAGHIDILVNNAGYGHFGTVESDGIDVVKHVFEVNYFGVYRMIEAVVPSMREHASGHIINISSIGGLVGAPFNDAYSSAKAAVDMLTESLATYMPSLGITMSVFNPGAITTNFLDSIKGLADGKATLHPSYVTLYEKFFGAIQTAFAGGQTPAEAAADIVKIIEAGKDANVRNVTLAAKDMALLKLSDLTGNIAVKATRSAFL
ncbi:hypothetical protein HK100_003567 [Physocladia obscura]|uniref:Uncharacterized protein n=1 Tax=Physocladia obscura TaxID=109957 RepID=A0AAD5X9B0_9FUNG|nr:hypothetical protein HK100_003567 [Physocladia obscura]